MGTLYIKDEGGHYRVAHTEEVVASAKSLLADRCVPGTLIDSARAAQDYLQFQLAGREREVFAVLFLDARHRVLAFEELFQGTIDGATVHPREVVKRALAHNAAVGIVAHNHPSGCSSPSQADQTITKRIKEALDLVEVRLLDHFVIGDDGVASFAQRGDL